MRTKISGHLFSSLFKSLSQSHETDLPHNPYTIALIRHVFLPSLPSTHFSTIPNRPMRGEKRDDTSEDRLLRKFNLDHENIKNTHEKESLRSIRKPMRGEKRDDPSSDFFLRKFDLDGEAVNIEKTRKVHQTFSTQMPNGTMGGEKEGNESDHLFGQEFKLSDDSEDGNMEKSNRNPHAQMANRPEREDRNDRADNLLSSQFEHGADLANVKGKNTTHQNPSIEIPKTEVADPDLSPQDADEIFRKMKETGLIPNAVAMLDGLCKDGLIQEAMKLFGLMREKGTIPEVVIYTAVVEGFCKASKFDDAKRIFRKMQNNGISPNAFSYTVLIQGLCKGRKLEDSINFCIEMLEAGHSPNVVTFVTFIDLFCREKGVEEAATVIGRLQEKGFAIDEKAVREHLDKKGPFSPTVWEVIFGKKNSQRLF